MLLSFEQVHVTMNVAGAQSLHSQKKKIQRFIDVFMEHVHTDTDIVHFSAVIHLV